MVFWGSGATLAQVWAAADMALGLMTLVNITALALLAPTIVAVSRDYTFKRKNNQPMVFHKSDCKIQGKTKPGIWE